jgi:membrane-associated phospholipid phosphatase
MSWFQHLDAELFRLLNQQLANPFFDRVMPWLSGNAVFFPFLLLAAVWFLWKTGKRGLIFMLVLVAAVAVTDGFVCKHLKEIVGRPRPFLLFPETHLLAGKAGSGSMPSSHAANWFAATLVACVYYRRTLWFMLPAALLVSFSRIYNGVHYPGDVLVGALVGAGTGAAILLVLNMLWGFVGRRWFPLWWEENPSLVWFRNRDETTSAEDEELALPPRRRTAAFALPARHATPDQQWLRLGYIVLALLFVVRLLYLLSGTIQLSEDEAYQWLWSKHLDISYFSEPPLIAYTQWLGTHIWGDTAFGVRFFSPVISLVLGLVVLRFFAREFNARAGFFLLLIVACTPMLSAGAVLMTVDPLSVLFWTAAMLAGSRAVQEQGSTRDWLWVGFWMALGFLSKYTELFQLLCWAVFFALWRPARKHLRRPGPYLALAINALGALPVLIWNAQRHWITVQHVAADAGLRKAWAPTLRYFAEFFGAEFGLLNPVFFVAMIWAALAFWRRGRQNPRMVYFFSMGAPLFLAYALYSFRSRLLPNWIVPSVLPLFCLMVLYWDTRYRLGSRKVARWLMAGFLIGAPFVVLGHQTDLVRKLTGHFLPVRFDPLHRVREWDTTARVIDAARLELTEEGKSVFIIADHYGIASQTSFYLPEARAALQEEVPLVYFRWTPTPRNQFFFWKSYLGRTGENAIFVRELARQDLKTKPLPPELVEQFETIEDLGLHTVYYHETLILRPLQLFACRGLKAQPLP